MKDNEDIKSKVLEETTKEIERVSNHREYTMSDMMCLFIPAKVEFMKKVYDALNNISFSTKEYKNIYDNKQFYDLCWLTWNAQGNKKPVDETVELVSNKLTYGSLNGLL